MRSLILSGLLFFVASCASTKINVIPLKGTYPVTPIQITTEKKFDEVWEKLVDVFAQKGLSIKIIDRSSGLIVSDRSLLTATVENNDGSLLYCNRIYSCTKSL